MPVVSSKETLTEQAIERLTAEIIKGVLPPERKLLVAELKERYGMGASPLREAMARLVSMGFVVFDRRRGFRVSPVSREDLEDLTLVRQSLDGAALERSMARGDVEWEVGLVAAFARLERAINSSAVGDTPESPVIESAHKQFHTALIAGCGSPRMMALHDLLYDQARRYRQISMQRIQDINHFLEIHRELMDLVLRRDPVIASPVLVAHIALTLGNVYPV